MASARYLRDALMFAPCYIALDWASYLDPIGLFNITPWNPQPALAIAWLMIGGLGNTPAVILTIIVSEFVVRQAPGGLGVTLAMGLVLGGCYAVIAGTLRRQLNGIGLGSLQQLTGFTAITLAGTALVSAGFIGLLQISNAIDEVPFVETWLRFWVGDLVGVLVTAPLLFAAADPHRRSSMIALAHRPETLVHVMALCATLWLVFDGLGGDPAAHFYLLFLPLIWIAIRSGMNGAIVAMAIVQMGVVAVVHSDAGAGFPLLEVQALVATLTLTGLFLGMTVDERARAEDSLRQSLRLAAAGEMAGAIAHEINQPLTALINYGRSTQMLLARGAPATDALPEVVGKMLNEAERAAETVKRLRDFFRAGTTRLETVETRELLEAARRIARQLIAERPVSLDTECGENLPALYVDRLQTEVILRNLLANAVEALSAAKNADGHILIRAERHDARHIRIIIKDNGPGIPEMRRQGLFKPFQSGKSTGMGMGLAVSRAIAEAHGGSLEAASSGHGEFRVILPCSQKI